MWHWRRSWFDRPRWWVTYLLNATSGVVVLEGLIWLGAPMVSPVMAVFLAAVISIGPTWRTQRNHDAWEQLEMSATAPRAQLEIAEGVVRYRRPCTSVVVLEEAIRIGELALEVRGSPRSGFLAAALLAAGAVLLAVATPWSWWLFLMGAAALVVGVDAVRAGALARRVDELREQLAAAEGAGLPFDLGEASDGRA